MRNGDGTSAMNLAQKDYEVLAGRSMTEPHLTLPSISVVLCCHNSSKRLPETLGHLETQEIPTGLEWEILMVDNASSDGTANLIAEFAREHPHLTVGIVNEPQLGASYARRCGITTARCEIVLFVDDDNWLAPNYLRLVAETLQKNPAISALGGMSTAECEGPEPAWMARYQGWYAVNGPADAQPVIKEETFLWTAGAAYRRETFDRIRSLKLPFLVSGRRGTTLDAGEDNELSELIKLAGGKMYRHTGLHFRHYLPAGRLSWDYLRRLRYAAGCVSVKLDAYRLPQARSIWPRRILRCWWAQFANVCLQVIRYQFMVWQPFQSAMQRDDRLLRLDTYRGRLAALWSYRQEYGEMVNQKYRLART
jgi:glycosyltransferase involved in cell wall biosynthesis